MRARVGPCGRPALAGDVPGRTDPHPRHVSAPAVDRRDAAGIRDRERVRSAPGRRRMRLLASGIAATVAFVVIRASGLYGDPNPWQADVSLTRTAIDFLNTTKYPPSLLFLLMTLGPAAILCALAEHVPAWLGARLVTFGRAPFALCATACCTRRSATRWASSRLRASPSRSSSRPGLRRTSPRVASTSSGCSTSSSPSSAAQGACRWLILVWSTPAQKRSVTFFPS